MFDDSKQSLPLPDQDEVIEDGTNCIVSGSGETLNQTEPWDELHEVLVPIWNHTKCAKVYRTWLTPRMICAGYENGGKDGKTLVFQVQGEKKLNLK